MLSVSSPLYKINKTFEENIRSRLPPRITIPSHLQRPPKASWSSFLGFPLASPIGAAACAATTGKGINLLSKLGFDVLTYKTIRRTPSLSYPLPNIVHVKCNTLLTDEDLSQPLYVNNKPMGANDRVAISNSFGNGCLKPEWIIQDIQYAKKAISEGQVLVVSVYGQGNSLQSLVHDYVETAFFAKMAGGDIIELNFSCPNLLKINELSTCESSVIYQITQRVVRRLKNTPVLLKLSLGHAYSSLPKILMAAAKAGARGITAINSVSMPILTNNQRPAFPHRRYAGVSGYPIRKLAVRYIQKLAQLNQKLKLDFVIFGTGGITSPKHFKLFLEAGADIALSATGMMWNPYLALQFHQKFHL